MIAAFLLGAAISASLAFLLAAAVLPLATRLGHVDRPGPGKHHPRVTPLGGGIAIFWATAIPLALAIFFAEQVGSLLRGLGGGAELERDLAAQSRSVAIFLGGALVIHLAGVWDDRRPLSPWVKLAVQVAAALPLVAGPGGGGVLPQWLDPVSSAGLALLWIVAVTNAFNFLDGADGMAATVGALCAAMFLASSVLSGQATEGLLFSCLMGALLAFLAFNFPPARMFMGDGGSLAVGYALAWGSLRLTYFDAGFRLESPWYAVFTPLVVLAIPLYDLVTVISLRLLHHRSPLRGDDQHFLHRLSRRGLGPRGVLLLVGAATLATGIGGVMLSRLAAWQAGLVVLQSALVLVVLLLLEIHLAGRANP